MINKILLNKIIYILYNTTVYIVSTVQYISLIKEIFMKKFFYIMFFFFQLIIHYKFNQQVTTPFFILLT